MVPEHELWTVILFCLWTVVLEKTLESYLDRRQIKPVNPKGNQLNIHWKDWCWSWSSDILATWCEELTHWKRPWCWERFKGRWRMGRQRMRWLDGSTDPMDMLLLLSRFSHVQLCAIDSSPPVSPVPRILQARTRVGCHFLLHCMKAASLFPL